MKKRKDVRTDNMNPEDRKRKLNFKKKKQSQNEAYFDKRKIRKLKDFDEFEDDEYDRR